MNIDLSLILELSIKFSNICIIADTYIKRQSYIVEFENTFHHHHVFIFDCSVLCVEKLYDTIFFIDVEFIDDHIIDNVFIPLIVIGGIHLHFSPRSYIFLRNNFDPHLCNILDKFIDIVHPSFS